MTLIRPARLEDWPRIQEIFAASGQAAWPHILPAELLANLTPPQRWSDAIGDPQQCVLVAEIDGLVVAFAVLRASGNEDADQATGELDSFYSHPACWGKGAGRELLAAATARLGEMGFTEATLWTAELNHRPRRIYEAAGWTPDGEHRERTLGERSFIELRYRLKALT